MSRTTVSCKERLLATCLGLPHGQRSGGRSATDLQKQVLITIRILGNPECLRSVAARFNITKLILFRIYRRICGAIANNLSGQYMKNLLVWDWAPLGKMINFGSFAQRNALDQWSNDPSIDHVDQWSDESLSRVDLIDHWSENGFARKERHRSEIEIRLLPKERTLSTLVLSGYSKNWKHLIVKQESMLWISKLLLYWYLLIISEKSFLSHKLRCYTGISGPEKSRNNTREKTSYFFTCVDIANQLLTRHSPLAPLGQFDEWSTKPSRFSILGGLSERSRIVAAKILKNSVSRQTVRFKLF